MNDFEPCLNCPDLTHEIDGLQIEIRERDKCIAELEAELCKPCGACGGTGESDECRDCDEGINAGFSTCAGCGLTLGERKCPACHGTGKQRRWVVPEDFCNDFRILYGIARSTIDIYKPKDIGLQLSPEKIKTQLEKDEKRIESIINKWQADCLLGNLRELTEAKE